MTGVTTLAPPAQISAQAAAELRSLPRDILTIRPIVATLVQVRTDPTHTGQPIATGDPVHFARCGESGYIAVYTVSPEQSVTIHSVRKAVGL